MFIDGKPMFIDDLPTEKPYDFHGGAWKNYHVWWAIFRNMIYYDFRDLGLHIHGISQ